MIFSTQARRPAKYEDAANVELEGVIELKRTVNTDCGFCHSHFFVRRRTGALILLLLFAMLFPPVPAHGATESSVAPDIPSAMELAQNYLMEKVPEPYPGSLGGEWTTIALARSDLAVKESIYKTYFDNATALLAETQGVLTRNKYSEYSRMILALTAIRKDPGSIAGYNLLSYLADFDLVKKQGINGPAYALIALDSNDYQIPAVTIAGTKTTREAILDHLISREIPGGGFALSGTTPDVDITAIVLQALSPYQNRTDVSPVVTRALKKLMELQSASFGFSSYGAENAESLSQVIMALTSLRIDPEEWSKGTVAELLSYQRADGGFSHIKSSDSELMATEQATLALASYRRFQKGASPLFEMKDVYGYRVRLNGAYLLFDQAPVNHGGRVLVPMRGIFEALGAEVSWNDKTKTATGILGGRQVSLTVGETTAYADGSVIELDVPAVIVNGRTLVPVRFIAESLNAKVDWYGEIKTVGIERR